AMAVQQCPPGGGEAIPGGGEGLAAGGRDGAGETVVVLQSVRLLPPQGGDIAALPGAEVNLPEARFDLEWQAPPNVEMLGKRPAALQGGAQHPLPAPVAFEGGGHLPPALSREGRIGAAAKDIAPLAGAVAQQVEGGGAVSHRCSPPLRQRWPSPCAGRRPPPAGAGRPRRRCPRRGASPG